MVEVKVKVKFWAYAKLHMTLVYICCFGPCACGGAGPTTQGQCDICFASLPSPGSPSNYLLINMNGKGIAVGLADH